MLDQRKIHNLRNVAYCLLENNACTKQQISSVTGLSNTTVSDSINNMQHIQLTREVGYHDSIGGRPSVIYELNPDFCYFLGVQISKDNLFVSLIDLKGNLVESKVVVIEPGKVILRVLERTIYEAIESSSQRIAAIGLGVNGTIDYKTDTVIKSNELGWMNVHLRELIERKFYIPTYVDNSINGLADLERIKWKLTSQSNYILLSQWYPEKAIIHLDGNILKGDYGRCGKGLNLEETIRLAEVLDISKIIYCTKPETENLSGQDSYSGQIYCRSSQQGEIATGVALEAEMLWLNSIYFLLQ